MAEPTAPANPARTVQCPACGGPSLYAPNNRYRPFCGQRCKTQDLGAWASEEFRVPTSPPLDPAAPEGDWRHPS